MRYLFVTIDGGGNLYPELALATRLVARGHEVRFLGHRSQRAAITRAGHGPAFRPYEHAPDFDATWSAASPIKDWADDPATVFAALCAHLWFGPAARFAADVAAEIARQPRDALVIDYFVLGGLIAAEKAGLPTAVLWHTAFGEWAAWNQGLATLNAARAGVGLPPLPDVFAQYRRMERVLVLTSAAFDLALGSLPLASRELPANVVHVGPQLATPPRRERATGAAPLVVVSLSTSYQAQEGVLRRVVAALGTLPVRGLVTTGPAVGYDGALPDNVEVETWVPHAEILPRAALVITHAGMGTVMAALAHGVPLLCLPMGRDQHGNAARVAHLGAGRVLAADARAAEIAAAVRDALADPALREGAARAAELVRADIDDDRAVRELEALARDARRGTGASRAVHSAPVGVRTSG